MQTNRPLWFPIVLALLATPVAATTLTCEPKTMEPWLIEDSPTTIDIDEASSTVTVHAGAYHCGPNPMISCNRAARTVGPLRATFSDTEIKFAENSNYPPYVINRLNGSVLGPEILIGVGRWTCQPAKKQF